MECYPSTRNSLWWVTNTRLRYDFNESMAVITKKKKKK